MLGKCPCVGITLGFHSYQPVQFTGKAALMPGGGIDGGG
jgi:hypothetical protein